MTIEEAYEFVLEQVRFIENLHDIDVKINDRGYSNSKSIGGLSSDCFVDIMFIISNDSQLEAIINALTNLAELNIIISYGGDVGHRIWKIDENFSIQSKEHVDEWFDKIMTLEDFFESKSKKDDKDPLSSLPICLN